MNLKKRLKSIGKRSKRRARTQGKQRKERPMRGASNATAAREFSLKQSISVSFVL